MVERRSLVREVVGSNPGRTNTQGLKIIEEKVLPLQLHQQTFHKKKERSVDPSLNVNMQVKLWHRILFFHSAHAMGNLRHPIGHSLCVTDSTAFC